jgi:dihydrolipoamide dehydrogenase
MRKTREIFKVIDIVMGELTTDVDVAVIGAGPGGYTAAIRAAQLGLETVLIEKALLGGCCTNLGCIPSKALIHAADVKYDSQFARKMGLNASVTLDFPAMQAWKDGVVKELRDGITTLCSLNGIEVIEGQAFFNSSDTLSVETEAGLRGIHFKNAIIATGTKIRGVENLPFDHKRIISSDDVFSLTQVPQRLVIIGAGYIAVEMANLFSKLGSRVTIVHHGDRLLKRMEPEITELLLKKMREMGIEVLFGSEITGLDGNDALARTPSGARRIPFDRLLVATGRTPYTEGLGLDKTKVTLNEEGLITVDSAMRTTDRSIFAIGDIVPGPQLAHKAFREAKIAAEVIAGKRSAFDNRAMPMVVFSKPEIGIVGLTEEEAARQGKPMIGRMPYSASGRAKTMGATDGFIKIVANAEGAILGVQIIGEGAGSVIAEATLAIEMAATLEDLAATIHAHPTMPEALAAAAEDALGRAIDLYRGKKG